MHIFCDRRAQQLKNLEIFMLALQSHNDLKIYNEKMHKA